MKYTKKYLSCCLAMALCLPAYPQAMNDFRKEIADTKYISVNKKCYPLDLIRAFGYESFEKVGTLKKQTGCTSGKEIVLDWVVMDTVSRSYVVSVSSCGIFSNTRYYIVQDGMKYQLKILGIYENYAEFKSAYLN